MDYNAREYSPVLGRFLSADTIVPNPGNPNSFNRYSYVENSPLEYIDPTGHDALGADWELEFKQVNGRDPTDEDRQIRLFSLIRKGPISGNDIWNADDWAEFGRKGRNYWFQNVNGRRSLADFANEISRLAKAYTDDEAVQFVSAIALLYAGIPYNTRGAFVVMQQGLGGDRINVSTCRGGRDDTCLWLNHWSYGFSRRFTNSDTEENTHHYAGHLLAGFYTGLSTNAQGTIGREVAQSYTEGRGGALQTDMADVRLGIVAGTTGYFLRMGGIKVSDLSIWIGNQLAPSKLVAEP